ncbi:unnamed protein product [Tilletia caries]|nr:unnamed protein product [Tilletia caries]
MDSARTHHNGGSAAVQHDPLLGVGSAPPPAPDTSPSSRPPTPPTKAAFQQPLPRTSTANRLVPEHAQARTQPGHHPAAYYNPTPPAPPPSSAVAAAAAAAAAAAQHQQPRQFFVRVRITSVELLPRAVAFHLDATTNLPHFRASTYPRITRSYREFVLYALALTLHIPSIIIPAVPIPLPTLSHAASAAAPASERPTPEERHLKINLARWLARLLEQPLVRDHLETRAFIESDYSYQPTPPKSASTAHGHSSNASAASTSAARKRWNSAVHAAASITGLPDRDFPDGIVHAIASGEGNGAAAFLLTSTATASAPQIDLGAGLGLPYGVFSTPANGSSGYASNSGGSGGGGGGTFSASRLSSFLKFGQSSSPSSPSTTTSSTTSANRLSTSRNLHDDDEDLVQARAEVTRLEMHFANAAIKADKVFGSTSALVGNLPSLGGGPDGVLASATGGKDGSSGGAGAGAGARAGVLQATYDLANKLHSLAMDEESRPTSVRGGLTRSLKSTAEMLRQSLKVEDAISNASTHSLLSALCYQSLNARSAKCALLQRNALVEEHNNALKQLALKKRDVDALRAGRGNGSTSRMRADMLLEELDEAARLERYLAHALSSLSATLTGSLVQHSRHAHTDLQGALLDHARSQLGLNRSLVGGLKALRRELGAIPSLDEVLEKEKKVAEERKRAFLADGGGAKSQGQGTVDQDQKGDGAVSESTSSLPTTSIRPASNPNPNPNTNTSTSTSFLPGTARTGSAAVLAAAGLGAQGSWHQRYAVMHTSRTLEEESTAEAERKGAMLAAAQKAEERERRRVEEEERRRRGGGGVVPPRGWEDEDGLVAGQGRASGPNSNLNSNGASQVPVPIAANGEEEDEDDDAPLGSKFRPAPVPAPLAPPALAPENPFLNAPSGGNGSGVLPPSEALHQQRNNNNNSSSSFLYPDSHGSAGGSTPGWGGPPPSTMATNGMPSPGFGSGPSPSAGFGGGYEQQQQQQQPPLQLPAQQDDWGSAPLSSSSSGFLGGAAAGVLNSSRFMGGRGGDGVEARGLEQDHAQGQGPQGQGQGFQRGPGSSLNQGGGGGGAPGGGGGGGGGGLFGRPRLSASDAARSLGGTF